MLAALFLLSIFSNGYFLLRSVFPAEKQILPKAFFIGSLFSVSIIFGLLFLLHSLTIACQIFFFGSFLLFLRYRSLYIGINKKEVILFTLISFTSFLVFEKSFSYWNSTFLIQSNLYQDFGAHIPFIRYFSQGNHYLSEVPFFAGKNLLYHFMFDFYAGIIEFLGVRIDIALNLLSALSMTSLFFVIVSFSQKLFKSKSVGVIACVLLILNSDLSFLNLFLQNGVSISSLYNHNTYPVGNMLGLGISGNFLNINVFLNQRQLIFGMLFIFVLLDFLLSLQNMKISPKQLGILVLTVGLMPFWHVPAVIASYLLLIGIFALFKEYRQTTLMIVGLSAILVLPQVLLIKLNSANQIVFKPGFTIHELTIKNFLLFWSWNLGFSIPFIVLGFIKSNIFQKKIFVLFLILFILPNLFLFSKDAFDNHKLFNIWIVIVDIFAAFGFITLFKGGHVLRVLAAVMIVLVCMSGMLNLLVIKNDIYARVPDSKSTNLIKFLGDHDFIFLTNGEIYDPLSVAGRRIYLGRPHYMYLYGADPSQRIKDRNNILSGVNDSIVRKRLIKDGISYIIIYKDKSVPNLFPANKVYFEDKYKKIYEDNFAAVYKV